MKENGQMRQDRRQLREHTILKASKSNEVMSYDDPNRGWGELH